MNENKQSDWKEREVGALWKQEGKKSNSIEKAQPSKITKKEIDNSIFISLRSSTSGHVTFNNSTGNMRVGK